MTAAVVHDPVATSGRVPTPGAFRALYLLVLRHQITRGRLVLFAIIGLVSLGIGVVLANNGGGVQGATDMVSAFGLGLVVPIIPLVLGSAAIGNWVEDETLVYVWLRPVSRWVIAAAATLAALTVAMPIVLISVTVIAAIGSNGHSGLITGALVSAAIGGMAYTTLFVLVGSLLRRSLLWGLIYVFIWEFFVARAGAGAARLSISSYASSLLSHFSGIDIRLADRAVWTSYTVPLVVTVLALALTTFRLHRANVA